MSAQFNQDAIRPIRALSRAIARSQPTLILPGDDRARGHLLLLHRTGSAAERRLIEDSLGSPAGYPISTSRSLLLATAKEVGIATPATMPVKTMEDLRGWMARVPPPWVLKADGTWGGTGVRIVDRPQTMETAFRALRQGATFPLALKRLIGHQDAFCLGDWLTARPRSVSVQTFIQGRPGNLAMVCRDGELLAANVVEAIASWGSTGPATIVRVVHRPDLVAGAGRLVRLLGLSGFVGLDFMVDGSDNVQLIEMNPRFTSLCNIRLDDGRDLIGAFMQSLTGRPNIPQEPAPEGLIASFPLAWHWNSRDGRLLSCHCDAPWDDPALMAAMLKLSRDHSLIARGRAAFWRPLDRSSMRRPSVSVRQSNISSSASDSCRASLSPRELCVTSPYTSSTSSRP